MLEAYQSYSTTLILLNVVVLVLLLTIRLRPTRKHPVGERGAYAQTPADASDSAIESSPARSTGTSDE